MIFLSDKIRKRCWDAVNFFGGVEGTLKEKDDALFKLIKTGIVEVKPNGSISFNVEKWVATPEGKEKFKRIIQSMPKVKDDEDTITLSRKELEAMKRHAKLMPDNEEDRAEFYGWNAAIDNILGNR
jgi:hypothetical protein